MRGMEVKYRKDMPILLNQVRICQDSPIPCLIDILHIDRFLRVSTMLSNMYGRHFVTLMRYIQ
jgi:hypothetical protein